MTSRAQHQNDGGRAGRGGAVANLSDQPPAPTPPHHAITSGSPPSRSEHQNGFAHSAHAIHHAERPDSASDRKTSRMAQIPRAGIRMVSNWATAGGCRPVTRSAGARPPRARPPPPSRAGGEKRPRPPPPPPARRPPAARRPS